MQSADALLSAGIAGSAWSAATVKSATVAGIWLKTGADIAVMAVIAAVTAGLVRIAKRSRIAMLSAADAVTAVKGVVTVCGVKVAGNVV